MTTYKEIKKEYQNKINKIWKAHALMMVFYSAWVLLSEVFLVLTTLASSFFMFWLLFGFKIENMLIAWIILIVNFLYYEFYNKSFYDKDIEPEMQEIFIHIQVFKDIKKELKQGHKNRMTP